MLITYIRTDPDKLVSAHFKVSDVWADAGLEKLVIDDALFPVLEKLYVHFLIKPRLRNRYVGTNRYAPISSASWRPTGTTLHKYTTALDIEVPGITALALARYCETLPEIGGIGLYTADANEQEHIHIDVKRSPSAHYKARWRRTCWWIKTSGSKTPGHGGIATVFHKGHRSMAVKQMQEALQKNGFDSSAADGEFKASTVSALKAYQRANGLIVDGKFGRQSNAKMKLFDW